MKIVENHIMEILSCISIPLPSKFFSSILRIITIATTMTASENILATSESVALL